MKYLGLAHDLRLALMPLVRQLRFQSPSGLPAGALSALAALDRSGPMTAGELARHEHVSGPMITKITKLLEAEGLVERVAGSEDARVVRISVTSAGRTALAEGRAAKDAWLAGRLADLTAEERRRLLDALPVLQKLVGDRR